MQPHVYICANCVRVVVVAISVIVIIMMIVVVVTYSYENVVVMWQTLGLI